MEKESVSKNERILGIYTKLIDGYIVNKSEEANRYKVDERTIQRDISDIRNFLDNQSVDNGVFNTVIYDNAKKGYTLEKVNKIKFSNEEILAISKILLDSRAFTKEEMKIMIDKLLYNCYPTKDKKVISELISNEMYHYIEPQHKTVFIDKMWEIGKAISSNKIIEIEYFKMQNKTDVKRRLQPLSIMFSEYYFYLIAFIDKNNSDEYENIDEFYPIIYRIDRISKLTVTNEHFKIPYKDRFEEGEFRKKIQFMQGGKLEKIKFKYRGNYLEAVLDRLPTAQVISEEDGVYTLVATGFGKGMRMWLGSQGDLVEIIEGK